MATNDMNIAELAEVIDSLYNLSMDGNVDLDNQKKYRHQAMQLRGQLVNVISQRFDKGVPAVQQANELIKGLNASLKDVSNEIDKTTATVNKAAKLAMKLDEVLKVVANFV